MRYCLLLLFAFIIDKGEGLQLFDRIRTRSLLLGIEEKCILESGASPGDIAEIILRNSPTRREGKCLISCILRSIGIQDKDVKARFRNLASNLLEELKKEDPDRYERVMKVVGKCAAEIYEKELEDPCELAFEIVTCGIREGLTNAIENLFSVLVRERHSLLPF